LKCHEREWFELAQELKVDAVALENLVAVVQEGKWQESVAPLMFVRVNVERRSEEWEDLFTEDGQLHKPQIFSPLPTRADRAWLKGWTCLKECITRVTPKDIEAASKTLNVVEDEEERSVICARALGLTRSQYLSGVSEAERRRRAAAWKRLYRNGIPSELRSALRATTGDHAIMRFGFEDREWRDIKDYGRRGERPAKATAVPRYDFQDDDWRARRVVQYATR
jgi:hypothetical protein